MAARGITSQVTGFLGRMIILSQTLLAASALAAPAAQLRGAWVTAWQPGFFTAAQADATVKAAKRGSVNALFVQVRKCADAYYDTTIEPRGTGIAADFDPLAYIIRKAHAEGIQVHAWVVVFRAWKGDKPPADPHHVINEHAEWLTKRYDGSSDAEEGLYLDPGIPEVREHVARVFAEIARAYDVDGIHLDYIRYPGKDFGYAEEALSRYYAETGASTKPKPADPAWAKWRREQVTETVRLIHAQVQRASPKVKLTAATIPWGDAPSKFTSSSAYTTVFQDWRTWLAAGILDANVPMNYKVEGSSGDQFRNWLGRFKTWGASKPVYVGVGAHCNEPPCVVKQIQAVENAKLDGFVLFAFNESPKRTALVEALHKYFSASK